MKKTPQKKLYMVNAGRRILVSVLALCAILGPVSARGAELCVQLKWMHQAQFSGLYIAKEEGLYKKAGLDVRLVEGGPGVDWQKTIRDGECPIGIVGPHEIVIARAGKVPVRAIAATAQVSPIVWFSLKESGIKDPRQFRGKKVVLVPTGKIHLLGMLKKVGVPYGQVKIEPFSTDLSRLYGGKVDVWSGYITSYVSKAEEEGHQVNIIHPINYGVQIYDDIIYVREDMIERSPEIVEAFLRATMDGWVMAMSEPELAVKDTLKYIENENAEHERKLLYRTIPYLHTGEVPIGWMESSVWQEICSLVRDVGMTEYAVPAEEVFTDRFLIKIYPGEKKK